MTAAADQASAPAAVGESTWRARRRLGARLGEIINELAGRNDILLGMVWDKSPQAEAAWFDPARIEVTINGARALDDGTDPDDVDPLTLSGRLRHPVIVGMCGHEAGHARSTRWSDWDQGAGRAVIRAAVLLEEPRIEHRHLQHRPDDQVFLRAMTRHVVLPGAAGGSPLAARWEAAAAVALILGRVEAQVLGDQDAAPVKDLAVSVLGDDDVEALRSLLGEALRLEDGDQPGLLDVARRWVEIVGADPDADLPGVGCAAGDPGDASPQPGEPSAMSAAVAAMTETVSIAAQITTGALPDPVVEAAQQARDLAAQRERDAEATAAADAQQAAQRVFGAAPTEQRQQGRSPVRGTRPPTQRERVTARRLADALARARFRAPVVTRRRSAIPPGRLMGREAMLGAAQRSMGLPVTAQPFQQRVRQRGEEPPVTVGAVVDVSGSMDPYTDPLASVAWAFAHAAHQTGGTSACVAFRTEVTPIVAPRQIPSQVTEFDAQLGNHRFTEAASAVDGALGLAGGRGVRVLVIASDGRWEPSERVGGQRLIDRLVRSGVVVLWICLGDADVLAGARRVEVSAFEEIPDALSAALVAEVSRA